MPSSLRFSSNEQMKVFASSGPRRDPIILDNDAGCIETSIRFYSNIYFENIVTHFQLAHCLGNGICSGRISFNSIEKNTGFSVSNIYIVKATPLYNNK